MIYLYSALIVSINIDNVDILFPITNSKIILLI